MLAKALCQFFIRIVWIATAQPEQQFVRLVRPRCIPGHNLGSQALCTTRPLRHPDGADGDLDMRQRSPPECRRGTKVRRSVAAPGLLHAKLGATRITNGSTSESARNVRSSLSCPNASRDR